MSGSNQNGSVMRGRRYVLRGGVQSASGGRSTRIRMEPGVRGDLLKTFVCLLPLAGTIEKFSWRKHGYPLTLATRSPVVGFPSSP